MINILQFKLNVYYKFRLSGAAAADNLDLYVAFDPNKRLRSGYTKIMKSFGLSTTEFTNEKIKFSNDFEIHSVPFEVGILKFNDNYFDLVFTSPPFFDYEIYNPENPNYINWINDFYIPLVQQVIMNINFLLDYYNDLKILL